mmetsp:Transcript_11553/g.16711  ORF Transcript_11553/g.16711 Transcript_11553/m.16711 type:complete len:210 (+) Transcript_11553:586-1215(+)
MSVSRAANKLVAPSGGVGYSFSANRASSSEFPLGPLNSSQEITPSPSMSSVSNTDKETWCHSAPNSSLVITPSLLSSRAAKTFTSRPSAPFGPVNSSNEINPSSSLSSATNTASGMACHSTINSSRDTNPSRSDVKAPSSWRKRLPLVNHRLNSTKSTIPSSLASSRLNTSFVLASPSLPAACRKLSSVYPPTFASPTSLLNTSVASSM